MLKKLERKNKDKGSTKVVKYQKIQEISMRRLRFKGQFLGENDEKQIKLLLAELPFANTMSPVQLTEFIKDYMSRK
jgi:hypothetical protein